MISLPQDKQLEALCALQSSHNDVLIKSPPEWLILCGLGTPDEILTCRTHWPSTKVCGIDLDLRVIEACRKGVRPQDLLLNKTLLDRTAVVDVLIGPPSVSTIHPQMVQKHGSSGKLTTTTIDLLDQEYGPFDNGVLWVDAEGSDPFILAGAAKTLSRGTTLAVVVEIWSSRPDLVREYSKMRTLLTNLGFHLVDLINPQWWGHNEIWLCDRLTEDMIRAG